MRRLGLSLAILYVTLSCGQRGEASTESDSSEEAAAETGDGDGAGDGDGDGAGDGDGDGAGDGDTGGDGDGDSECVPTGMGASTTPIDLVDIASGTGGFVLNGEGFPHEGSARVSDAGDVNGDGLSDLIVAFRSHLTISTRRVRGYVVFGKSDGAAIELSDVEAGVGGFAIISEAATSTGFIVSGAGDVNGDGLSDLVVGDTDGRYIPDYGTYYDRGRSYVVFGKADTEAVDLADVAAGTGGFAIGVESFDGLFSGASVSGAGDVNGDGLADLIVGGPSYGPGVGGDGDGDTDPYNLTWQGRSYVVFGKTDTSAVRLTDLAAENGGFVLTGEKVGNKAGESVSAAGDVNGDGLADLVVAASGYRFTGMPRPVGRAYVVFGKTGTAPVELSDVAAGTGGFVLNGPQVLYDDFNRGISVSGARDVNGDGLADVIVGAFGWGWKGEDQPAGDGLSYVVFGKNDTDPVDLAGIAAAGGGFEVRGDEYWDRTAFDVSGAGDVNGDGFADVMVGAPGVEGGDGRAYVVFGKAGATPVELTTVATGCGGFAINGGYRAYAGRTVSDAGDVNGDGLPDYIVGAGSVYCGGDGDGDGDSDYDSCGRAYVVFGRP